MTYVQAGDLSRHSSSRKNGALNPGFIPQEIYSTFALPSLSLSQFLLTH